MAGVLAVPPILMHTVLMANTKTPKRSFRDFTPGTQVKLTGKFLQSTGQARGGEGLSKWIVQACDCGLCKGGEHVRTDERRPDAYCESMWTAEELEQHPSLRFRHIAKANLFIVGQLDSRNCP
jgi:hypothetical protein